jgi:hypothetical protein
MSRKSKTTPQAPPAKISRWRCGAPAGNRNAARPVTPLSRVRDLQRRIRAALKQAKACEDAGSGYQ